MPLTPSTNLLELVPAVVKGGLVPTPNSSEAVFAVDASGRSWVYKEVIGYQEVLAEALGHLLATRVGAPTPAFAYTPGQGSPGWLSELLQPSRHWISHRAFNVMNFPELGRLLTLDAVLGNADRHPGNLLLTPIGDALHLRAVGIDFADSLVGQIVDFEGLGTACPQIGERHVRGVPADLVLDGMMQAGTLLRDLDNEALHDIVDEACRVAGEREIARLFNVLRRRCNAAPAIADSYHRALGALG